MAISDREPEQKTLMIENGIEALEEENFEIRRKIRQAALAARDAMSPEERSKGSLMMTERLLGHQWFYKSGIFLCFVSYGSEIDTHELLSEALRLGKKVYVPKVTKVSENHIMSFHRLTDLSELAKGYKGIPEPSGMTEEYIYRPDEADSTLLLMPGAAFDGCRNRLGYGKGFYDRFLADKEALWHRSIAVGFQCQLVAEIPERQGDIKPYQVICF